MASYAATCNAVSNFVRTLFEHLYYTCTACITETHELFILYKNSDYYLHNGMCKFRQPFYAPYYYIGDVQARDFTVCQFVKLNNWLTKLVNLRP